MRRTTVLVVLALAAGALRPSAADAPAGAARVASSSYFGGSADDGVSAMTVTPTGDVYVAGMTTSADLPTTTWIGNEGFVEGAFVAKFTPAGVLVWCTRVGGATTCNGLAVDSKGRAWIVGETGSGAFPLKNASQRNAGGQGDAYVVRLAADGSTQEFATFLGGSEWDVAEAVAIDSQDRAVVVGLTYSNGFPRIRPTQAAHGGGLDAFVTRFGETGPDFSTLLGGEGADWALAVGIGPSDDVWVGGVARSPDFPTTADVPEPTPSPDQFGAFLARIDPDMPLLVASTLFSSTAAWDLRVRGLVVDAAGACSFVVVADGNLPPVGSGLARPPLVKPPVTSLEGPRTLRYHQDKHSIYFEPAGGEYGALDTWRGGNSLFGRWSADGRKWEALWGLEGDATAIARATGGEIAIVGGQARCATPGAWRYGDPARVTTNYMSGDPGDGFLACLSADGRRFTYATQIGGAGVTRGAGVGFDGAGGVWFAGTTDARDLATRAAQQASFGGGKDGCLVHLRAPAAPPTAFSVAKQGDQVALAWTDASAGSASFEIETTSSQAVGDHAAFATAPHVVASLPPGTTTWTAPADTASDVAYRVVAVTPDGASAGTPLRSPGFLHPASPHDVTATAVKGKRVRVRWSVADNGASRFVVLDDDGSIVARGSKRTRSALVRVTGVAAGRGYRVMALGKKGTSLPSERAEVGR